MPGIKNRLPVLLAVLAVPAVCASAVRQLSPEQRTCISTRLSASTGTNLRADERDAFALADPYTGRILWLENRKTLARRSFQPGSIFKLVTTYAALSGIIDPQEIYICPGGKTRIGPTGAEVGCWLRRGHGPVNLTKALALSCNLYFAHIAERIGTGPILSAAREFGLGQATGSDLGGELAGHLPAFPPAGQAARLATGQAYGLRVTPLQMLSVIGAIANGGLLYSLRLANPGKGPTRVRGEMKDGSALRFIRNALEQASSYGTGLAQHLSELKLAGKTGTAAWDGINWRTHAWYVGFAPARQPLVSLVVFVFDGTGAKEAATLARKILLNSYQAMRTCGVAEIQP